MSRARALALGCVVACAACTDGPPMPDEIVTIERAMRGEYRGVLLAPTGVWFERRRLFGIDELGARGDELVAALARAREQRPSDRRMTLITTLVTEPSSRVIGTIWRITRAGFDEIAIYRPRGERLDPICEPLTWRQLEAGADDADQPVRLSIYVKTTETWIGLSRINEFQQIPLVHAGGHDLDKIADTLRIHKESAFFAEREDAQLAADADVPAGPFVDIMRLACGKFPHLKTLVPTELAARPML